MQDGASALQVAAEEGHDDVIQSLMRYKATVDLKKNVSIYNLIAIALKKIVSNKNVGYFYHFP